MTRSDSDGQRITLHRALFLDEMARLKLISGAQSDAENGARGRAVPAQPEIQDERDWLLVWQYDPDIVRIVLRPVTIWYEHPDGSRQRYSPNFLIEHRETIGRSAILCDIKPSGFAAGAGADYSVRFRAASRYAQLRGWRFTVFQSRQISPQRLRLARQLDRNRFYEANDLEIQWLKSSLAKSGSVQIGQFFQSSAGHRSQEDLRRIIWAALAGGRIGFSTDTLICAGTTISVIAN